MPAPHHSVFLQAGCPSCRPTNSVKALKATCHQHQCFIYCGLFYGVFIVPALVCMCCSRSLDIHMPDYPLVVTLGFNHNHPLDTASVLRHRDVAPYVSAKFAELLSTGCSPLAALAVHKYDLCLEHGPRQYLNFVNDRHHFPDAAWCYRYVLVHVCHAE